MSRFIVRERTLVPSKSQEVKEATYDQLLKMQQDALPVKKRTRRKRDFGTYSYRGQQFLISWIREGAVVMLLDSETKAPVAKVKVVKDDAYKACRLLVGILELENKLGMLEVRTLS